MISMYSMTSPIASESDVTMTSCTATTVTAATISSNYQQTTSSKHLRLLDVLHHATYCFSVGANVQDSCACEYNPSCHQMKQLLHHCDMCILTVSSCVICKDIHRLLLEHAQECEDQDCKVLKCKELKKELSEVKSMHERLFTSYNALFPSTETATTICATKLSPQTPGTGRAGSITSSAVQLKLPTYHGNEGYQNFPANGVSLMHGSFYDSDSCSSRGESPRRDVMLELPANDKYSPFTFDNGPMINLPVRPSSNALKSVIEEKDIIAQNKLKKKNARKALKKMASAGRSTTSRSNNMPRPPSSDRSTLSKCNSHELILPSSSSPSCQQNVRSLQRSRSFSEYSDSSNDGSSCCPSPSGYGNMVDNFDQPRFKLARSYSTCSEGSISDASYGGRPSGCPSSISCCDDESDGTDLNAEAADLSLLDLKIAVAATNYEDDFAGVQHHLCRNDPIIPIQGNELYISNMSNMPFIHSEVMLDYSRNEVSRAVLPDFNIPAGEQLDTTDTDRLFTLFDEDDELFRYLDGEDENGGVESTK